MRTEFIKITGARENNLKNISVEIPKYKLVALTGVSGSGKSSFAMDILQKECQRQYATFSNSLNINVGLSSTLIPCISFSAPFIFLLAAYILLP